MKYYRKMVEHFISVNDNEWNNAVKIFNETSVKKDTIVHRSGEIFNDIWFIKSGLARSFFLDVNGKEYTWQLYFRGKSKHGLNYFMDDSVSFYEKQDHC